MPQAALAEPLSCLAHGWDVINPVNVGTNVLVIGSGIIGLLWACLLHLHGSRKTVTISEPIEARREAVKKLGNKLNNYISILLFSICHGIFYNASLKVRHNINNLLSKKVINVKFDNNKSVIMKYVILCY